jgi:hypothetical protein
VCVPWGVVVCGREDPSARRRGAHMHAPGLDREPVRSAHSPVGNVSGRRGRRGRLVPPLPWAQRVGALPCMTGRCPAERCSERRGRRARTVVARAWPLIQWVVRWWPGRAVVCAAESREAALAWRDHVQQWSRARWLTRLRRAAARSDPPPRRAPRPHGRPRRPGNRRATLAAVLPADETPWPKLTGAPWSGAGPRAVDGCTDTAVW